MTDELPPATATSSPSPKLDFPHGTPQSKATDRADVLSADVFCINNEWIIRITLKGGSFFDVMFTSENYDYLLSIGIGVRIPPSGLPTAAPPAP
jgi:hypothetical protein